MNESTPEPLTTSPPEQVDARLQDLEREVDAERLEERLEQLEAERDFRSGQERRFQELQMAVEEVLQEVRGASDMGYVSGFASEESEEEAAFLPPFPPQYAPQRSGLEAWLQSWESNGASTTPLELQLPAGLHAQLQRLAETEGLPLDRLCLSVLSSWAGFRLGERKRP